MSVFAANFTAIDFETANHRRDSACQLAAVRVRDGKIEDSAMWMIRPKPFFFTRSNIRIHGITPQQVAEEPEFGDLWEQIQQVIGDDCLVAHNAVFDIGVLLECLRRHRQGIPEIEFTCTRAIAKATWPGRQRYGLKPLANWLGIRFKHHDALEDSIACAKVLLAAGIDRRVESLPDLEGSLCLQRGSAGSWGFRGPRRRRRGERNASRAARSRPPIHQQLNLPLGRRSVQELTAPYEAQFEPHCESLTATDVDLQRLLIRADFIRPLSGKCVVFSGRLRSISYEQAHQLTKRAGGNCHDTVNVQTDLVVIGEATEGNGSELQTARQSADDLKRGGVRIQILSEEEFIGLVIASP